MCVSGPRVRQTTGSSLQFTAPPALHCLIPAPYYTGGPSWLFGAAPGGKIWAIWPQHHRMPMSNLEAKKTSATWTTTKPIQLAWLPRFAPTSVSHPLSVLRGSHTEIRTGFLCYAHGVAGPAMEQTPCAAELRPALEQTPCAVATAPHLPRTERTHTEWQELNDQLAT